MDEKKIIKISKFLSYWLRHHPEDIGLNISSEGWVDVKELLEKSKHKIIFDFNELKYVVQNNDKQRFQFSDDFFCSIRASQGHSIKVDLKLEEVVPPQFLYHGTLEANLKSIMKDGLTKQNRNHVHLSKDIETAKIVAGRRSGSKVILQIEALGVRADKNKIFISDNGVYLTETVPSKFITTLEIYK